MWRKFVWFLLFFILFFSLGSLLLPQLYLFELAISFLPYMLVANFFMMFVIFVGNYRFYWKYDLTMIYFLFCVIFIYIFVGFYSFSVVDKVDDVDLSFFYANIYYKNENYDDIILRVEEYDADVLLFVEFDQHHIENIKQELLDVYPYTLTTWWDDAVVGDLVMSKYAFEDLYDDVDDGSRKYSYFKINMSDYDYYVYLVHTAAPVSLRFFRMRNAQLDRLANAINENRKGMKDDDRLIVVGDFNVSPWSYYYKRFVNEIGLKNVDSVWNILFTWRLFILPIFWSNIDHVLVDDLSEIVHLEQFGIRGSDHVGYYIEG